jgi:hypothetical protein
MLRPCCEIVNHNCNEQDQKLELSPEVGEGSCELLAAIMIPDGLPDSFDAVRPACLRALHTVTCANIDQQRSQGTY